MSDDTDIITRDSLPVLREEEDEEENTYDFSKTLDENYLAQIRSCVPFKTMRMLTPLKIDTILEHVRNGMSLSTAGASVGVVPSTLGSYLADGKREYEAMTDEDFEGFDDPEDALTEKARFFIQVAQAKGECIVTLQNILMDKASEAGKEWIPQWLLQVMEPETYSLKYRTEKMKLEAKAQETLSAVGKIEFVFIDGFASRAEDEKDYIDEKLSELENKWGKATTTVNVVEAEYNVVEEEGEEDSDDLIDDEDT